MAEKDKASTKNTAQTKTSTKNATASKSSAETKSVEQKNAGAAKTTKTATAKNADATKATKSSTAKAADTASAKTEKSKTTKTVAKNEETVKNSEKKTEKVEVAKVEKKTSKKADAETVFEKSDKAVETKVKEKPVKEPKEKSVKKVASEAESDKGVRANGNGTATLSKKKMSAIISSAVALILVIVLVMGIVFGLKACDRRNLPQLGTGDTEILPTVTVAGDRPSQSDTVLLNPIDPSLIDPSCGEIFDQDYTATSVVGYSAQVVGTIAPENVNKPVEEIRDDREYFDIGIDIPDGGVRYPVFGYTMSSVVGADDEAGSKAAARGVLIAESSYLTATGTANAGTGGYTWMDENGYLYSGTRHENASENTPAVYPDGTPRQLYQHTASVGLYLGNVGAPDVDPRIIKEVTMRYRGYNGYGVTGLYAPAGEVIKIELSDADMNATGGITIHIGQALYNGQANNIWVDKGQMQRIPHLLNTMTVNKNTAYFDEETGYWTAYVGSFIGGPLYIRNTAATFTARISGGVTYRHFVLGYTTPEEFEASCASTVPYFDLEVWDRGVLHSGPLAYAKAFSYDDLYKAAILWEKVASVTTTGSYQGIVFLYDPFVAAGAAVAFPGRRSVNCPMGWMTSSLNYNSIVTSGSWGNFHEYHHNFQGYGVGNGGEVTNNGMTLVSYALFTKISANRGIGSYGAQGLGGWNNYTSAPWALQSTLNISDPNYSLTLYATLLHNFGANNYINAKIQQQTHHYGENFTGYMRAWQDITHNDMTYFFKDILHGISGDIANQYTNSDYSMFVPVASVYQTGRSYMYDGQKQYFQTMQPYVIPYGQNFNIDLSKYNAPGGQYASGSIVIPDGFSYRVKSITQPQHGTIERVDNFNFTYIPDRNDTSKTSGQIVVTLEIIKNDGAFKVDDVDLVLEFELSHETNKLTLDRTTYTFTSETMYTDAQTAFESNFSGFDSKKTISHTNPTQNCNTDIWFYPDTEANREAHPDVPEHYFVHDNTIDVIDGKLYVDDDGKYRVYLRGRLNCALYFSLDGKDYKLGATIKDVTAPSNSAAFRVNDSNTYFDIEFDDGNITVTTYTGGEKTYTFKQSGDVRWIYIKEVLIVQSAPSVSYIGVGLTAWSEPLYRIVEKYYDADGNEVASPDDENYDHAETFYYDNAGNEVDADVVAAAQKVPPTSGTYVNAYRSDYEFPDNSGFVSDYFYVRGYNYNYQSDEVKYSTWDDGVKIVATNFVAESSAYTIDKLLEEGTTTYCHPRANGGNNVFITLDMGKVITANRINFLGRTDRPATTAQQGLPNQFTVEISMDGQTFEMVGEFTNSNGSAYSALVDLGVDLTFQYIRITVVNTHSNTGRLILSGIEFSYVFTLKGNGANHINPADENIIYTGDWEVVPTASYFGCELVGKADSRVFMEFKGTRLAIITSTVNDSNFEVYIDGVKVNNVNENAPSGDYCITYLSDKVESGTHTVEIRCTGDTYIDSFAIYDEG